MLIDYHIHALSHGEYRPELSWYEEYLLRAQALGLREVGFSEHDEYWELVKPDAIRSLGSVFPNINIRVGLETEFCHIGQLELNKFMLKGGLDYVIGSVHFLNDWNFDHPDFQDRFNYYSIDEIYEQYFMELTAMVKSHCFDIVGHLDLIKIWGHRPQKSISTYLQPLIGVIRQSGMAVELNSGGLRKPIGEMYPSPELIRKFYDANIPMTLGSDAHHPDQVGYELSSGQQLIYKAGYRKLAVFNRRQLQLVHI